MMITDTSWHAWSLSLLYIHFWVEYWMRVRAQFFLRTHQRACFLHWLVMRIDTLVEFFWIIAAKELAPAQHKRYCVTHNHFFLRQFSEKLNKRVNYHKQSMGKTNWAGTPIWYSTLLHRIYVIKLTYRVLLKWS